jgi:hypothetical protein
MPFNNPFEGEKTVIKSLALGGTQGEGLPVL